jgi:hypothetical protein
VKVTVLDVQGRELADLVHGRLEAGRHERGWEGRDRQGRPVEAGVFFFRIEARSLAGGRGITAVRKAVLVR